MKYLHGQKVYLRALEPTDLEFLFRLENDSDVWEVSNTIAPYSKFVLKQYLDNSHKDIYEVKQLRLVICLSEEDNDRTLGFVDLFDFDPKNKRVGMGILIFSEKDRGQGFAKEALELLTSYAFEVLEMHQLYANISQDNNKSIGLFEQMGFVQSGVKKDWIIAAGAYKDELFYQKFRN